MVKNHITLDDLLAFKQALIDELLEILERNQPVTVRRWLKAAEARRLLGVTVNVLRNLREKGSIPYKRVDSGAFIYDYRTVIEMTAPRAKRFPRKAFVDDLGFGEGGEA